MTSRQSSLPNNTPIHLPPLSPPLPSHPQASSNSSLPIVYSLKLPQDVVKTLLSAPATTSVCFKNSESAEIIIPNAPSIPFAVRPIADANASTARAACYTRREKSLRTVGPIVAELSLDRKLSRSVAATTKKRTLDARNAGARDLKLVDDIPASQPAKKPRRKPTEKRTRTPRRPSNIASTPKPLPTKSALPQPNGVRPPRIGTANSAVMPANTSPPFRSPTVSPGHSNGKPNGSRRSTPTRNAFSAMQSRKVSPRALASSLPKPVSRLTPTRPSRFSPVGSAGHSPSINSPGSPPLAAIRPPRVGDHTELRRQLLHFLTMGEYDMKTIKERMESRQVDFSHRTLAATLSEIADVNDGKYTLTEESWKDVTEKEYSGAELTKMRKFRSSALGSSGGELEPYNMSDEQLNVAIDNFHKEYTKAEEKVTNEEDEAKLREKFTCLFPLYKAVITRMEQLQDTFKALETRFLAAKGKEEKESLARKITDNHRKFKGRHAHFERVLPLLHSKMKRIRKSLDDYAKYEEDR